MINSILQADQSFFYILNGLLGNNGFFDVIIKFTSVYLVYCVPLALLISWFIYKNDRDHIAMLKATIASVFMWQVPTRIIAWLWYRPRPIVALADTKELMFHVPSYSFPSDHSTFLMALASYFYLLGYKKVGIWTGIIAIIVGVSRVIAGLHYPGDILAGWLLGIIGAYLLFLIDKLIEKYAAKPLLAVAKFIKLA